MRKFLLALLFPFILVEAFSQITYIGIINHNTGSGSNNLFNNYVAVGQQCYIDWEVYADGMTNMEACGFRSDSRLILRREGNKEATSVVASAPIIVPGICAGKNGNNDHYYVELSAYIDKPGRYSVEIQADLPNMTYPFENASTKTTWNYSCPSAYYLTGTGGPTGNYYTPSGSCTGGAGLSDPVGGQGTDMLTEVFPALKFFTVGELGTYREMAVFNGNFYDLQNGKFQPGNPTLPESLNGTNGIPSYGICATQPAPQLSIGGEINTFKRTNCINADITNAGLFYWLHKRGQQLSGYASFALNFKDDCSFNANGPEGNNFPGGGSCQNTNGILDQRWQTIVAENNILPPVFSLSDTGIWEIKLYTQIISMNCAGTPIVITGDTAVTTFTVINPETNGSPCSSVIPVIISAFTVTPSVNSNILNWKVEQAATIKNFTVQRSFDGYTYSNIATVPFNGQTFFSYNDAPCPGRIAFYRIVVNELNGHLLYSFIVKANTKASAVKISVQPSSEDLTLRLQNFNKGKYALDVVNTAGSLVAQKLIFVSAIGNTNLAVALKTELAHGVYYAVIKDEQGNMIAKSSFYY